MPEYIINILILMTIQPVKLHSVSEAVDLLTVINQLKRDGKLEEVGGTYYISTLTNGVSSSANTSEPSYAPLTLPQRY